MLKSINLKQIRESTHQIIYISFLRELQLPTRSTHLLTKLTVLCVKLYSSSPTQRAFSSEAQKSKRQTSQASFALRTADCGLRTALASSFVRLSKLQYAHVYMPIYVHMYVCGYNGIQICTSWLCLAAAATTERQVALLWHTFRWRSCASLFGFTHDEIVGAGWRRCVFETPVCVYQKNRWKEC